MSQEPNNVEQESLGNVKKVSQPLTNKAKRKAGGIAVSAGKKALAAGGKAMLGILKVIGPTLLVLLLIIIMSSLAFNIIFEWRGTEKEYSQVEENPSDLGADGIFMTSEGQITERSKLVRDFYRYYGETSTWKLLGSDKENFLDRSGEKYAEVIDFIQREKLFELNSHMLISLDDFLYEEGVRNPFQFTQKVNYDTDTLELKPISDDDGEIIVESDERDLETGEVTGEKIKSIRDYGLASILVYNEKEDYKKTTRIVGKYVAKDVWDSSAGKVTTVSIDEDIDITIETEDIYVIDKATTFAGNIEYFYDYQDVALRGMFGGSTADESKAHKQYHYDTYTEEYDCEMIKTGSINKEGIEIETEVCKTREHKLYKHRSDDTKVVENIPVAIEEIKKEDDSNYFKDYVENFESYIHEELLEEDYLLKKIDYESFVFDDASTIDQGGLLDKGASIDSESYENTIAYLKTIEKYTESFNINPKIIVAMIAQESGGKSYINGGLAQIVFGDNEKTKDAQAINKEGVTITIKVEKEQVNDPEIAIKYMVVKYAELLGLYEGNPLKAMQAYNLGTGTMGEIKKASGSKWATDYGWMDHIEEGRLKTFPNSRSISYSCTVNPGYSSTVKVRGDSCYIYNVLQYYDGDDIDAPKGLVQRAMSFFGEKIKEAFPIIDDVKPGKQSDYTPLVHETIPEDIIGTTIAFDNELLFSDAGEMSVRNFYNLGFFEPNIGIGQNYYDIVSMTPGSKGFIWPAPVDVTRVSSPFGMRFHPVHKEWRFHGGIDIPLAKGRSVYAVGDGVVIRAATAGGYGKLVSINHGGGVETRYAHNSTLLVREGDIVKQGDEIARAGSTGVSTGPHIHFEVRVGGSPVDPLPWVRDMGVKKVNDR